MHMTNENFDALIHLAQSIADINTNMKVAQSHDFVQGYHSISIDSWDALSQMLIVKKFATVVQVICLHNPSSFS